MNSRESSGLGIEPSLSGPKPEIKLPADEEERFNRGDLVGKVLEIWRKSFSETDESKLPPEYLCRNEIGISLARQQEPKWDYVKHDVENRYQGKLPEGALAAAWEYMRDFAETGGQNNFEDLNRRLSELKADKEKLEKYMRIDDAGPESRARDSAQIDKIEKDIKSLQSEMEVIREYNK